MPAEPMPRSTAVKTRHSLLAALGGMVALTVVLVLGAHALHAYFSQKQRLIAAMQHDVGQSLTGLKSNIAPFMEALAANEYAKLVATEIDLHPYYAIVVQDFSLGKILGQPEFVTGLLRNPDRSLTDFDAGATPHQRRLQEAFFKKSTSIQSSTGETLGQVSIYVTDEAIQKELNRAMRESLIVTVAMASLLIGLLLVFAHRLLIRPLQQIAGAIAQRDSEGIPVSPSPDFAYAEVSTLTNTLNTMLDVIRRSRDGLQQERRRLENVIEGTNAGTWEWHIPSGELVINERWAGMLGYNVEELSPATFETWSTKLHPDDLTLNGMVAPPEPASMCQSGVFSDNH